MKHLLAAVIFMALGISLNAWAVATPGTQPVQLLAIPCGVLSGYHAGKFLITRWEKRHGRDRQTAEDHPDPQAIGTALSNGGTFNITFDPSTNTFASVNSPIGLEAARLASELDVVHEEMPILAHRAARLSHARGGMTFAALNRKAGDKPVTFTADEDATCRCGFDDPVGLSYLSLSTTVANLMAGGSRHSVVPAVNGRCGWYAVPSDVDAWHEPNTIDLLVELSGRVIEHEKGYRAEHQRVVEIRLPGCWLCGQPSTHALFDTDECRRFACEYHLAPGLVAVCAGDIQRVLNVPVVAQP